MITLSANFMHSNVERRAKLAESKWEILKKLREVIRERPKKFKELQDQFKVMKGGIWRTVPRRTLYYYLGILKTLGDVINEQDYWFIKEAKKAQFFRREEDRKNAITHSLLLVLGNEDTPGVAKYPTHFLLQDFALGNRDHPDFFQHLETGYPRIYEKIEEYCKVQDDTGRLVFTLPYRPPSRKKNQDLKRTETQFDRLFKEIAGELENIYRRVANGPNPLDGCCDSCPSPRYPCDRCPVMQETKE